MYAFQRTSPSSAQSTIITIGLSVSGQCPCFLRISLLITQVPALPIHVPDVFSSADLFFLPSRAESFGHAILEALQAGCPILISDRTPWRNLAASGVGWDLSLDRPELFRDVIERCACASAEERAAQRQAATEWAERIIFDSDAVQRTSELLRATAAQVDKAPYPPNQRRRT